MTDLIALALLTDMGKGPRRRVLVGARDGNYCRGCGFAHGVAFLTLDHIIPRARGGHGRSANRMLLCPTCNHAKANRLPSEPGWPTWLEPLRLELLAIVQRQEVPV